MRFAWIQKKSGRDPGAQQGPAHPLTLVRAAYNLVFWVFLLPFASIMDYRTGFAAFSVVIVVRLGINLYVNNFAHFQPVEYLRFPFRIPG